MRKHQIFIGLGFLGLIFAFQNCGPAKFSITGGNANSAASTGNPNGVSAVTYLCSPFAGAASAISPNNGIVTTITYLPSSSSVLNQPINVSSFAIGAPDVVQIPTQLMLNQFSVETQDFNDGFALANGGVLTDNSGNKLVQYFSFLANGTIGLANSSANGETTPGAYQFALLSDDGAIFSITDSANQQLVLNNDGSHSNKLICSSAAASLLASQPMTYEMQYFQGPADRLGLMLFWRPITASNQTSAFNDPLCSLGAEGDSYYFTNDSNDKPVPTANYAALLADGWQPVPAGNFFLPSGVLNTCN